MVGSPLAPEPGQSPSTPSKASSHESELLIDGALDVINPATGKVFATSPRADQAQAEIAIAAAKRAFPAWAALPPPPDRRPSSPSPTGSRPASPTARRGGPHRRIHVRPAARRPE
ncbi:MAG: aldehyde dehydrogenase family protein [Caulobacter sp.]|nr:aldehyde dehydrogenase family protein [Caulobacter sp.]